MSSSSTSTAPWSRSSSRRARDFGRHEEERARRKLQERGARVVTERLPDEVVKVDGPTCVLSFQASALASAWPSSTANTCTGRASTRWAPQARATADNSGTHTATDMGSGGWASWGWQKAAFVKKVKYRTTGSSLVDLPAATQDVTDSACYSGADFNLGDSNWKRGMYLVVRAREWLSRSPSRPIHPGWLRCSSVTYCKYAPSSRLALRAPRTGSSTDLAIRGP
jgi:hypothetical protein